MVANRMKDLIVDESKWYYLIETSLTNSNKTEYFLKRSPFLAFFFLTQTKTKDSYVGDIMKWLAAAIMLYNFKLFQTQT